MAGEQSVLRTVTSRIIAMSCALLLSGCSYGVLTFFFTGVPDPNQKDVAYAASELPAQQQTHPLAIKEQQDYQHGPWAAGQCGLCHMSGSGQSANAIRATDSRSQLLEGKTELCVGCHGLPKDQSTSSTYWVHGPVTNGLCTECHSPHKSGNPYMLLLPTGEEICGACHDTAHANPIGAQKRLEETDCLACHNPHAGDTRMLLKSGVI